MSLSSVALCPHDRGLRRAPAPFQHPYLPTRRPLHRLPVPVRISYEALSRSSAVLPSLIKAICNQGATAFIQLRPDIAEFALLKAIVFCNPGTEWGVIKQGFVACEGLSAAGRQVVGAERNAFTGNLFEYCRLKHGAQDGVTRFTELLSLTQLFQYLAQKWRYHHLLVKVGNPKFQTLGAKRAAVLGRETLPRVVRRTHGMILQSLISDQ